MEKSDKPTNLTKSMDETQKFPLRRFYFLLIFILTLLSPLGLSLETDDIKSAPWKMSANIQITSLTVTFLILAWLPLLIPWLISISPRFQKFFTGLREGGVEEIEAGILRIKLSPGIQKAAEIYKHEVDPDQPKKSEPSPDELENSYRESLKAINDSKAVSSHEAMGKVNELSQYYDHIRATLASSTKRTRLMRDLSAMIWSLMPSIENFPVKEWLKSPKGGERLSAYKYLEYEPSLMYVDLLLSRAVGVLEEPYGQYGALLALRRTVINLEITTMQKELIASQLKWASQIEFIGRDRVNLMMAILSILEKGENK